MTEIEKYCDSLVAKIAYLQADNDRLEVEKENRDETIDTYKERIEFLEGYAARLRAALAGVKMAGAYDCYYCPVCGGESFHDSIGRGDSTPEDVIPKPDCQHQAALGLEKP